MKKFKICFKFCIKIENNFLKKYFIFKNPCYHEFVYDFWKNRNIPSLFEKVILKNHWEIHWASTGAVGGEGAGLAKLFNKSDIWSLPAGGVEIDHDWLGRDRRENVAG